MEITQELLKEILYYDKLTGFFYWKQRTASHFQDGIRKNASEICSWWNKKYARKVAGTVNAHGYIVISLFGVDYKAHVLAFIYVKGEKPQKQIDHKNHDRGDNSWNNIREVSSRENMKNKTRYKNNKSGHDGIYWNKATNSWRVIIGIEGKTHHKGLFKSFEDAVVKREEEKAKANYHVNHGKAKELENV